MRNNLYEDAQENHKLHPDTFDAPSPEQLAAIKPDSFVKVCRNDECFWLEVIYVDDKSIAGAVNNDLIYNPDLPLGTVVTVKKSQVYAVLKRP